VKTRRANISGRVSAIWKSEPRLRSYKLQRGKSGIAVLAVLSVVALFASFMWRSNETIQATNAFSDIAMQQQREAKTSADALAALRAQTIPLAPQGGQNGTFTDIGAGMVSDLLGKFSTLNETGTYTPQIGQDLAKKMGQSVAPTVTYDPYDATTVRADTDTSAARTLTYRKDLQTSLRPLLLNDEVEYTVFARYIESGDRDQLIKLQQYADNYRVAASQTAALVVPADARSYHLTLLNALQKFAATLDSLSTHAADPFASAALLVTYNSAENDVQTSFGGLVAYFKQKLL